MNKKIAKGLFYSLEFIRREPVYKFIKSHEAIQTLPSSAIKQIQKEKLIELLDYVIIHNKYYQNKYRGYDIVKDFKELPILTKTELRDNYKAIVTNNRINLDLAKTSGSTGKVLKFYRDRITFAHALSSKYCGYRWHGLDVGSKEGRLWGVPIRLSDRFKTKLKDIVLNRFRETEFDISERVLFDFHNKIIKKHPEYIYGYTSMIYEFSLFMMEKGIDGGSYKLKAVICTSESIPEFQREIIEKNFKCKIISEYGAAETGIISFECKHGHHHIMEDAIYLEVVDGRNKPVKTGDEGRILVTVLNNFTSPIIRYDLEDIVVLSDQKCSCGINFSFLKKIVGRVSSVVITPNGNVFHSLIFYYIMKGLTGKRGFIKQFKFYQKKIDHLDCEIVPTKLIEDKHLKLFRNIIKNNFGENMHLNIKIVEKIEREPSGKLRDFVSELNAEDYLQKYYSSGVAQSRF